MDWTQVVTIIASNMDWAQLAANVVVFLWIIRQITQYKKEFNEAITSMKDDISTLNTHLELMEEREKNRRKKEK